MAPPPKNCRLMMFMDPDYEMFSGFYDKLLAHLGCSMSCSCFLILSNAMMCSISASKSVYFPLTLRPCMLLVWTKSMNWWFFWFTYRSVSFKFVEISSRWIDDFFDLLRNIVSASKLYIFLFFWSVVCEPR